MPDENLQEAWQARYGTPAPDAPDIANFLRHRSIRAYDDRPIPEATIQALVAAAQSAATSSNLQLWTVISVQDPERRKQIAALCEGNPQIEAAPWFFAFFADHHRLKQAARRAGEDVQNVDYTEFFTMAVIDAALAAERLVCAAENLGLGICYIGALRNHPEEVAQFFDLPDGVFGVFGLCLGYPVQPSKAEIKPRLSQSAIWHRERYDRSPDVEEYNRRTKPFYERQGMKGDYDWSKRSGRRLSQLTGREVLLDWLRGRGFLRR